MRTGRRASAGATGMVLSRRFVKVRAAPALLARPVISRPCCPICCSYGQGRARIAGFSRSLEQTIHVSASWTEYLATPARFHYRAVEPSLLGWQRSVPRGDRFAADGRRDCRRRRVPRTPGQDVPRDRCLRGLPVVRHEGAGLRCVVPTFPLLQAVRSPVRFGHLAILATAVLAGFGLVEIRRHVPVRAWTLLSTAALAFITLESMAAPLHLTRYAASPASTGNSARNHTRWSPNCRSRAPHI